MTREEFIHEFAVYFLSQLSTRDVEESLYHNKMLDKACELYPGDKLDGLGDRYAASKVKEDLQAYLLKSITQTTNIKEEWGLLPTYRGDKIYDLLKEFGW